METGPTWRLGAVIGRRYRLDGEIGRGGFGAVFRATTLDTRAAVAVKLLAGAVRYDETSIARLRREAELAMRLTHPSTVRVLDHGDAGDGTPFVAFELLDGTTLEERLRAGGPLPHAEALFVTQALLGSLEEAHTLGIVHRDIKPANVVLRAGAGLESVKLLDFGVAKVAGEQAALTKEGLIVGTPAYMAPEQIGGGDVRPATDLYAVGLCLAEMVTGTPIYRGAAMAICVEKLRAGRAALPEGVVRSPFGGVVERATRPSPEARYGSAAELARALAAVGVIPAAVGTASAPDARGPEEGLAPTERAPDRTSALTRGRGPRWIVVLALVITAGAIGLGVWANRRSATERAEPVARAERTEPGPRPDREAPLSPPATAAGQPAGPRRRPDPCARPPGDAAAATKLIEAVGGEHGLPQAEGVTYDSYKVAFTRAARDNSDFLVARVFEGIGLDEVGSIALFSSTQAAALDDFTEASLSATTVARGRDKVVVIDGFSDAARPKIKAKLCGEP